MTTDVATPGTPLTAVPQRPTTAFSVLIGLTALLVLLQGVWAGVFLQKDGARDDYSSWIDVHANGAHIATVLALAAAVVGFVTRRARKDLWIGATALFVLILVESYIGGLIRDDDKDTLTIVHVPLAMAIMGLVVWLPMKAAGFRVSRR